MQRQKTLDISMDKSDRKVSLLALVFFLIGALPLYTYFQVSLERGGLTASALQFNPLLKMAILGTMLAVALELAQYF